MKSVKLTWDTSEDKIYGVDVFTNSTYHEGEHNQREVALITLLLGKHWIHLNLYARKDEVPRTARVWGVSYEPGYGWLNSWGERQIEDTKEFFAMLDGIAKAKSGRQPESE